MIVYAKGNLLLDKSQALVNTVNCVSVMGKGLAKEFKWRYPENYYLYVKACHSKKVVIGRMFITNGLDNGQPRYIINFPTKLHWRNDSKLDYIDEGLIDLVKQISRLNITSIAIPPLGCGNGGLNWEIVRPKIIEAVKDLDVEVTIYCP